VKDFEVNLKQLEKTIEKLSSGESSLNEAIDLYKKGLELVKISYQQLQDTEKEVKLLIDKNGKLQKKEFKIDKEEE
jgi:exodeoxyribonuclease VII small subunit